MTATLVDDLPLDRSDLVYLINAAEMEDDRPGLGMAALDPAECLARRAALKERLAPLQGRTRVKVVPYSLEKQWN